MIKNVSLIIFLFMCSNAWATFVPESQIDYTHLSVGIRQVEPNDFNKIIQNLQNEFSGIVSAQGGHLSISGNWKSEKINAAASQFRDNWQVVVTGGLARRPELTTDGFALILCHEIGHHLAGFPFGSVPLPIIPVWSAAEGEADYFASRVCAKHIWANDLEKNAESWSKANALVQEICKTNQQEENAQHLCARILTGVESVIATMAGIKKEPMAKFNTPDPAVVKETNSAHPATQCRMDTSYMGAICSAPFDFSIIPGKKVSAGPTSLDAEREAAKYSCTAFSNFTTGLRPTCWYKARL